MGSTSHLGSLLLMTHGIAPNTALCSGRGVASPELTHVPSHMIPGEADVDKIEDKHGATTCCNNNCCVAVRKN